MAFFKKLKHKIHLLIFYGFFAACLEYYFSRSMHKLDGTARIGAYLFIWACFNMAYSRIALSMQKGVEFILSTTSPLFLYYFIWLPVTRHLLGITPFNVRYLVPYVNIAIAAFLFLLTLSQTGMINDEIAWAYAEKATKAGAVKRFMEEVERDGDATAIMSAKNRASKHTDHTYTRLLGTEKKGSKGSRPTVGPFGEMRSQQSVA